MPNEIVDEFFASDISGEIMELESECLAPLMTELESIQDDGIRSFVKAILLKVELFWKVPSSNTPEYYPPDESFEYGLLVHTKRVFRVVEILCALYEIDDQDSDQLKAAALLHDVTKPLYLDEDNFIFDYLHPYTVDTLYKQVQKEDVLHSNSSQANVLNVSGPVLNNILKTVRSHKGSQSPVPETKPSKDSLPMILHVANEIAKSLHYIIDGNEVILERWLVEMEDGEPE